MYAPSFAVPNPIFQPAMRIISNITNADVVTITTTFPHQYITGLIIKLNIPIGFGMQQINQQFGPIIVTGDTTFTMQINSTYYDSFVLPAGNGPFQDPQCIPFAEVNSTFEGAKKNVLPYSAT